jgi:hypothetical protein
LHDGAVIVGGMPRAELGHPTTSTRGIGTNIHSHRPGYRYTTFG